MCNSILLSWGILNFGGIWVQYGSWLAQVFFFKDHIAIAWHLTVIKYRCKYISMDCDYIYQSSAAPINIQQLCGQKYSCELGIQPEHNKEVVVEEEKQRGSQVAYRWRAHKALWSYQVLTIKQPLKSETELKHSRDTQLFQFYKDYDGSKSVKGRRWRSWAERRVIRQRVYWCGPGTCSYQV